MSNTISPLPEWAPVAPVLVVRVPVMEAEERARLRAELAESIREGVMLLDLSMKYEVVDLPLPRPWPPVLVQGEEEAGNGEGPAKYPPPMRARRDPRTAAEKVDILARLGAYRKEKGLGSFEPLARACGGGVTAEVIRILYNGEAAYPIDVWRRVGRGLAKLGYPEEAAHGQAD